MIFKNQGVKINLNTVSTTQNGYNNFGEEEGKYTYTNYASNGSYKRDSNKDQLKWQRKNNK